MGFCEASGEAWRWVSATAWFEAGAGVDVAATVALRAAVAVVASAASVDPPAPVGVALRESSSREAHWARVLRRRTCASASRAAKREGVRRPARRGAPTAAGRGVLLGRRQCIPLGDGRGLGARSGRLSGRGLARVLFRRVVGVRVTVVVFLVVVVVVHVILVTRGGCGRSSGCVCLRCQPEEAQSVLFLLLFVGPLRTFLRAFPIVRAFHERAAVRGLGIQFCPRVRPRGSGGWGGGGGSRRRSVASMLRASGQSRRTVQEQ